MVSSYITGGGTNISDGYGMNSTDMTPIRFVFLGSNSFAGYTQRDHILATLLAEQHFEVIYIERMPSFAAWVRNVFYKLLYLKGLEKNSSRESHDSLHILTPPMVPTFSMNSLTPLLDRWLFRQWFKKRVPFAIRQQSMIIVATPYWWSGFLQRSDFPNSYLVYDKSDDILVSAYTSPTIRRLKRAEEALVRDADHVIVSAYTMAEQIVHKHCTVIPNAVSDRMVQAGEKAKEQYDGKKRICFLGAFDERWIDIPLLKESALAYPLCEFLFIGRINHRIAREFREVKNVSILGSKAGEELLKLLRSMDVFLIPFKNNAITEVVNPLKLYEYCAFGTPIVATRTNELNRYADYVYLSSTSKEFIENIRCTIEERNPLLQERRKRFAKENRWSARLTTLLTVCESLAVKNVEENTLLEKGTL